MFNCFITLILALLLFTSAIGDQAISPQNFGPSYLYPSNPTERLYKLPWTAGKTFNTWDGYGSEPGGSHHPDFSIDFGTPEGEPVLAARGGVVSIAYGADSICNIPTSQGNKVVILHLDSMQDTTSPTGWRKCRIMDLYLHVQKNIPVKAGQQIQQGQVIAYSSCTGQDGGVSHIHFKTYFDNSLSFAGFYVHNGWFESAPSYFFTSIPTPFVEVTNHPNGLSEQNDRLTSQNEIYSATENKGYRKTLANTAIVTATPNPFRPITKLSVIIPGSDNISLKIFTLTGQHMATVYEGYYENGMDGLTFDAAHLPAGIYIAKLTTASGQRAITKLNLLK